MRIVDIFEAKAPFKGRFGADDAGQAFFKLDEVKQIIRRDYKFAASYIVKRVELGFRFYQNPKAIDQTMEIIQNFEDLIDSLGWGDPDSNLSGSEQVTASIGYSWHTYFSLDKSMGLHYYEDRGMGADEIIIFAKEKTQFENLKSLLIKYKFIQSKEERQAGRTRKANYRQKLLKNKGIDIGTKIPLDISDVKGIGKVTKIRPSGMLEITITDIEPRENGEKYFEIWKAGRIIKRIGDVLVLGPIGLKRIENETK